MLKMSILMLNKKHLIKGVLSYEFYARVVLLSP